jgi:asparagine synthase (glutamine-hydrolysing)
MPGIFGVIDKTGNRTESGRDCSRRTVDMMAGAMMYESSYRCSRHEFPELGVYAGWVGRTDTAATSAPVDVLGVSLFVGGELSPDAGGTDATRRAIQSYVRAPRDFPAAVSGLCSGLLVDETRRTVLLFNDRLGMERLFIYENDDRFLFSSEAKAILAAVRTTRSFDPEGLAEFLATGCTFGGRSLFQGIRILPASTVVDLAGGNGPRERRYFDPATWENLAPLPEQTFLGELGEALDEAVRSHTSPHGGVALSLTGGLDSRMVIAAANAPEGAVPCYTFGSMYRDTYDVRVAGAIARACHQPHHVLVLDQEFARTSSQWLERAVYISDGYLGLSGAAELYLNRLARRVAPVRVTGNYGGELLRGFRAFKSSIPKGDFLAPDMARRVREASETFDALDRMRPLSFTLLCQAPSGYGRYAIERSQVAVRSPFLDYRVIPLLYRSPGRFAKGTEPSAFLVGRRRPDLLGIPTDRGKLGGGGRLRQRALHAYRELLFRGEYWTGHGAPDWVSRLTRHQSGRWLERMFVGRHKFLHPRIVIRNELGDYMRDILLAGHDASLGSYFDRNRVAALVQAHWRGERNYCNELDRLLTVALTSRWLLQLR